MRTLSASDRGSLRTLVGNWTNSGSVRWGVAWVWSAGVQGSLSTLVGNWKNVSGQIVGSWYGGNQEYIHP